MVVQEVRVLVQMNVIVFIRGTGGHDRAILVFGVAVGNLCSAVIGAVWNEPGKRDIDIFV